LLLAWLALMVLVHTVSLHATPRLIMGFTMRHLARLAGGWNHVYTPPIATWRQRGIVMPSPDVLYAVCPLDLGSGDVLVEAPVPHQTYWSLAVYDERTDNLYVTDDLQQTGERVRVRLTAGAAPVPTAGKADDAVPVVSLGGRHGLVLLRTVVSDPHDPFDALDALRRQTRCSVVSN